MRCVALTLGLLLTTVVTATAQPGDGGKPAITIVAPESGCKLPAGEKLVIIAVVQEGLDIGLVTFMYDDRGIGAVQKAPFTLEWDTTDIPPGPHAIEAVAHTTSGEKLGSEPVSITIVSAKNEAVVVKDTPAVSDSQPDPVRLKEGTPVLLKTVAELKSGGTPQGSAVTLEVARDVIAPDGRILVAYASKAVGTVTRSSKRGMLGKNGKLEFTTDSCTAVDGTPVPLRAQEFKASGKNNSGAVVATVLLISVLGVFVHGRDVTVPAGTEITAYVDRTTEVQHPERGVGAPRGEVMEAVRVTSPADGATLTSDDEIPIVLEITPIAKAYKVELYIDDKKVKDQTKDSITGSFSVKLSSGKHTIRAEVQFLNGRVVRTDPVRVTVT